MKTTHTTSQVVVLGTAHGHVYALAHAATQGVGLSLAGVYEPDPDLRPKAEQTLGMAATDDLEAVLAAGPALALIGAEPAHRADLAARATAVGAAVLVDKPLALTEDALDRLIAAQEKNGRPVVIYFPYRGHPLVRAARDQLDRGTIGELVRVYASGPHKLNAPGRPDWHWTREGNGGALIDIGSHHFDLCCFMADAAPTRVQATHVNRTQPEHREFQDYAFARLDFPGHTTGLVEVDWLNPASMKNFGDTRFQLMGTAGKIELRLGDIIEGRLYTHDTADQPLDTADYPPADQWTIALTDQLAHGRTPGVPQDEVWRACRVSLKAFESAQSGGQSVMM